MVLQHSPLDYWKEYLVIAAGFISLLIARVYLFKKSYYNKLKCYSNPMELAKEVMSEHRKKKSVLEIT